ncbi:HAD family hydrolase [Nonomuraea sp. ATR24]|uniref:HAD family hydrolase n=1 Tax=Nonomuraea sp. ATR24 TaxID=1676744 RepID=UPI0035C08E4F
MITSAVRGVLFDLDGTLLDHRAAADAGITAWVAERAPGRPRLAEAARLWEALEEPHLAAWHAGECSWQEQRRRRVRALCAELGLDLPDDPDTAFASYARRYREAWRAYPDAAAAVAALRGFRLGVLTNGGPAAAGMRSAWLDRLGIAPPPAGFPRITTLAELPALLSGEHLSGHSDLG